MTETTTVTLRDVEWSNGTPQSGLALCDCGKGFAATRFVRVAGGWMATCPRCGAEGVVKQGAKSNS